MAVPYTQALGIIKDINSCLTTLRLYPAENVLVKRTLTSLITAMNRVFDQQPGFTMSLSQGRLFLDGAQVEEKHRNTPIVQAVVSLLQSLSLSSITLHKGIKTQDFIAFFSLLNEMKAANSRQGVSVEAQIKARGIEHITIDETVFVALKRKDKEALQERDMDISQAIHQVLLSPSATVHPDAESAEEHFQLFSRDPEKMGAVLSNLVEKNSQSFAQQSRNMTIALNRLAGMIPGSDQEHLSSLVSILKNIPVAMTASFIMSRVATRKDPVIDADVLISYLDDATLGAFMEQVSMLEEKFITDTEKLPQEKRQMYRDRVKAFLVQLGEYLASREDLPVDTPEEEEAERVIAFPEDLEPAPILNLENYLLKEMRKLSSDIEAKLFTGISMAQLLLEADDDTIGIILAFLKEKLGDEAFDLDETIALYTLEFTAALHIPTASQEDIAKWVKHLLAELDKEVELNVWYSTIVNVFRDNFSHIVKQSFLDMASWVLLTLHRHAHNTDGSREKEQAYYAYRVFKNIFPPELVPTITSMFSAGDISLNDPFYLLMVQLPEQFVPPAIDIIKHSDNMKVRKLALNYLSGAEEKAVEPLLLELNKHQPWYVHRNILLILGKIRFPSTVFIIKKFLYHKDQRIVREAVKALVNIQSPSAIKNLAAAFVGLPIKTKIRIMSAIQNQDWEPMLPVLKEYITTQEFMESRNRALVGSTFSALASISLKEALALVEDILWGAKDKLLASGSQMIVLKNITFLLRSSESPRARELLARLKQDTRGFVKALFT